jgi:hypothetical protein
VVFEPLDFLSRLAALVPSPRVNLTRFHGVFAPVRGNVAQRGQGRATSRPSSMGWAQRLKRVFGMEIRKCEHCAGAVRIIACIEDAQVIEKILQHLGLRHTLLFNASILGFAIDVTAGLIGGN